MLFKSRRYFRITAAVAATIAVSAFAASAADVIKIGAPLALTGPLADEAKKQDVVWNMWLDKVNAAGGINVGSKKMRVQLVKYDYQSDGPRSGQLAEKLITDDKVDFMLAPFGSGHTKITAAVAERYQTPLVACASSSESVFDQGLKNLFGTLAPNGSMNDTMVKFFKAKVPQVQRVAVLGRDDVFPKSMAQGVSAAAKVNGLEVVYDWIYVTGYTQDLILARKQMSDLGVKAPIITMMTGPAYKEFTDGLGALANDVTSYSWWHHATSYKGVGAWPTTEDFYNEFTAKNKHDPDYIHASCAAAVVVLGNAIERAGLVDKKTVRDALASTDIVTFYGPVKFSPNGMNQARNVPIIQVQDGKVKVLSPDNIKNAEFRLIK